MNRTKLISQIKAKESYLCIGLDSDITKIPAHLLNAQDPIFEFNKQIIDATEKYAVSYKINTAFYEALGTKGWESLQKTIDYLPKDIFIIADAKRGDIGNTSSQYAKAFFENLNCDAVTVAPYMGEDSVKPFLEIKDKWTILLALTSNSGAQDFEMLELKNGKKVYEEVLEKSQNWGTDENLMYVVGATKAEYIENIRKIIPNHFLLVPGVGAQGGNLAEVSKAGMTKECGLLINSSRQIIYASKDKDFAEMAAKKAQEIQQEMAIQLSVTK
ncbi:orotidine-5'-phosphate decarboxylase [Bernardetia litoralis DSM 6794]|uniref:Orotidine-5'-phosphate decarboxylase n=1 Tax=Bernardetia litoralis (strain ATCC 23117 / DSM 6794 / NBRC 15988 / NCIMB 1366 / Fx l1 / Sio-4) TaxID=880071 RepID=I4AIC9_BERLS|nr:orotidine-5'-phosphate decarboxylase [Bernardetia litoralis]AFM03714.1 orotidine-5'-phosphate decarboxylase [Bernardetia litoralis DSM 6794]